MRSLDAVICITGTALLLVSCAANQITKSTKIIGNEVSTFQASLSGFQDDMKTLQDNEQARIAGTAARRDLAIAATKQQQVEWIIIQAKTENEVFTNLQAQGRDEIVRLLPPSTLAPRPPAVKLPLDKLGSVATAMDKLSRQPRIKTELEFLINYGMTVNKKLKAIEDDAKKTPKTSDTTAAKPTQSN